ncbi:hypothetical protein ACYULU_12490 [Breznakiellaceae bacterium SP9]
MKRPMTKNALRARAAGAVAAIVMASSVLAACPNPTEASEPPNPEAELQAAIEWINKPERKAASFSDPSNAYLLPDAFMNPTTRQQVKDSYIEAVKEYQKTKNDKFDPTIKEELKKTGITTQGMQLIISKIATASKVRGA